MESQPQNPEFRNNHENFHPCLCLAVFYLRYFAVEEIKKIMKWVEVVRIDPGNGVHK